MIAHGDPMQSAAFVAIVTMTIITLRKVAPGASTWEAQTTTTKKRPTPDAMVHLSTAIVLAASLGFILGTGNLLWWEPIHLSATRDLPYLNRLSRLTSSQLASLIGTGVSITILLSGVGVAVVLNEFPTIRKQKTTTKTNSKHRLLMTRSEAFAVVALMCELGFMLWKVIAGMFVQRPVTRPSMIGLFWGLAWAMIGQVMVLTYHYMRRAGIMLQYPLLQPKRPPTYSSFWHQTLHHLVNPSAFALMAVYLSGTWVMGMMPASYYQYNASMDVLHVVAQLVVVDFFTVVNHVAQHAIPPLYKMSHKPHHRFVSPQLFDAFDGSLFDTVLLILLPLFCTMQVVRFASTWSYIVFGFVYSTHFFLIHSEWSHPGDGIASAIGVYVARHHHAHHALFNKNYAHFFTWWDRMMGTYAAGLEEVDVVG